MNIGLVLFFTRGVSLRTWAMIGMLEREVALYVRLLKRGFEVDFVTYGGSSDLEYADKLPGISILCNKDDLPWEEYERRLLDLHANSLERCHVIKTNQTYGAEMALDAATAFRKGFVARCGYMWSQNAAREHGYDSDQAREARRVESKVFAAADRVIVTTRAMADDVIRRVPEAASRTAVVPNYVDTDVFRPMDVPGEKNTLVFIGRIAPEKNLEALLTAIQSLDVKLILIGEGKLRPHLQEKFGSLGGRVTWEGNIPNSRLPEFINHAGVFILPSLYEGHPKSLLEAMACGVPVIGADSPGIREIIRHGETGYLCGTDAASMKAAIEEIMAHPDLASNMGANARRFIQDEYSLDNIVTMEADLLREAGSRQ
jgi:glycosyltransferase involved in cell wall biosynthesis